ncbi:MAG: hypothetical protein V7727_03340 [Sneathiella sp.]
MDYKFKFDDVTISFHYLERNIDNDGKAPKLKKFTEAEFETLFQNLENLKNPDLEEEEVDSKIRYHAQVIIENVEQLEGRSIAGIYKTSYWGHAFENQDYGPIPAESMNFRSFFFLIYLSDSGHLYIGSQYLGPYGGYTALKNTIMSAIDDKKGISALSFNSSTYYFENAEPKQVHISYSLPPEKITGENSYGNSVVLALKKGSPKDNFEQDVKKDFFPRFGRPKDETRKWLADLLGEKKLLEVKDEDIDQCKIVVRIGGKTKTLHLLDHNEFATRFVIDVDMKPDGHPKYEPLKMEAIELLKNEILKKK